MISDPDPEVVDLIVLRPEQLTHGMRVVNIGTVVGAPRRDGVFTAVDMGVTRYSLATGRAYVNTEMFVFHAADEIWVVEG